MFSGSIKVLLVILCYLHINFLDDLNHLTDWVTQKCDSSELFKMTCDFLHTRNVSSVPFMPTRKTFHFNFNCQSFVFHLTLVFTQKSLFSLYTWACGSGDTQNERWTSLFTFSSYLIPETGKREQKCFFFKQFHAEKIDSIFVLQIIVWNILLQCHLHVLCL